jgi:hypothetical protein
METFNFVILNAIIDAFFEFERFTRLVITLNSDSANILTSD